MLVFFDTSAWIKYFLNENGTERIQRFIVEFSQYEENSVAASVITYAEMIATLRRACNGRRISEEEFENLLHEFKEQWEKTDIVGVSSELTEHSGELANDYALKGCDAFQLASALETQADIFISCDNDLNDAAESCGLPVWNPGEEDFQNPI